MCGKKPTKPPQVVERDPIAEQAEADRKAQMEANAATVSKRRRRASSGGGLAGRAIRAATLGGAGEGNSLLAQAQARPPVQTKP